MQGLGWFSLHSNAPSSVFQGRSCFLCSRTDGTHGKHRQNILFLWPARLCLTPNPPTPHRAQQLHPQPRCSQFGQRCPFLSQGCGCPLRAGNVARHGDSPGCCPGGCGHGDAFGTLPWPVGPAGFPGRGSGAAPLQEAGITCAAALPPCTIPAAPVGKALLSSQALIAELAASQLGQRGSCSLLGGLVIHHGK